MSYSDSSCITDSSTELSITLEHEIWEDEHDETWDDEQDETEWENYILEDQEYIPNNQDKNTLLDTINTNICKNDSKNKSIINTSKHPSKEYNKTIQTICDSMMKITGSAPIEIALIITEMFAEGVCCSRRKECPQWGKIPFFVIGWDKAHLDIRHGEFEPNKKYGIEHISKYAFKYQPYYVPLFESDGTFIRYTCPHDYQEYYKDEFTFWNKRTGLSTYNDVAIDRGKFTRCENQSRPCDKCRTYRESNEYMVCMFCDLKICKKRCERNLDMDLELGICVYNDNVKRGLLWRKFTIWFDFELFNSVYVCETCGKTKNPDDIDKVFTEAYPNKHIDISPDKQL